MQFITIIRKSHISNEDAVTHLGNPIGIGEEQVVLRCCCKAFLGELRAILAMFLHLQIRPSLAPAPAVREEA